MDISQLRNPYDYANPVRDASLFAGRMETLAKIASLLSQAGPTQPVSYIAIHGKRAAGKTSLLNIAEYLAREKQYLTVRVDLVAGDSSSRKFYAKVYEELIGVVGNSVELKDLSGREITPRIVRRIISGQPTDDNFPLEFPESLASLENADSPISEMALRADLEYIARLAGRTIVLLIDEAQVIASQENALSVLRTLGARLQGYVFVIAGTTDLIPTIKQVFGPLLRQFEIISVEGFIESADVMSCMSLPLASLGLPAKICFSNPDGTARDMMGLTDGNPYEIQLYCHAMFSRWQNQASRRMELSPETIDTVRLMLEAGTNVQGHPILVKIRAMPLVQLEALNILCSSLGYATIDELWFAYCLFSDSKMTREELNEHLNDFIREKIVEIDNGVVRFLGDHFDEIYFRLWSRKRFRQRDRGDRHTTHGRHQQLLSHHDFTNVLTRSLEYMLCDIRPEKLRILPTCCTGLRPSVLAQGIANLAELPDSGKVSHTAPFLYQAIVRCGMPSALNLTAITCSYNGIQAVRWLYATDADDIDLNSLESFADESQKVSKLGGDLHSERSRIELGPWSDILDWVVARVSFEKSRKEMSDFHANESHSAYSRGDVDMAVNHLTASFKLNESWLPANNLAYIELARNDYKESTKWSDIALGVSRAPKEVALTRYNAAMAAILAKDYGAARNHLTEASNALADLPFSSYECSYLLIPKFGKEVLKLNEEADVDLSTALANASELLDVVIRLHEIQDN